MVRVLSKMRRANWGLGPGRTMQRPYASVTMAMAEDFATLRWAAVD
eukprot:COSAG05_NODE_14920_length_383_cov_0.774648_1_plen_45_part_01